MSDLTVQTLDDVSFDSAVSSGGGVWLLDFWADWCAPCHALTPVLDDLATELTGVVQIGKVDVTVSPRLTERFEVQTVPTILVVVHGAEVRRTYGAKTRRQLVRLLGEFVPALDLS